MAELDALLADADIGAWVRANVRWHDFIPWDYEEPGHPKPCPTACGGCGHPEELHPWATLHIPSRHAGYCHPLNVLLAAHPDTSRRDGEHEPPDSTTCP